MVLDLVFDALRGGTQGGGGGVLALMAHPDDEALSCGGTLALVASRGIPVHVTCFSDGAQGRDSVLAESCDRLGASCDLLRMEATRFRLDGALVTTVDAALAEHRPAIVVSHSLQGSQSQDHPVLAQAVEIAVRRNSRFPAVHLAAEPPLASTGFVPNVFVDVSSTWDKKLQAVGLHRGVLDRFYMDDEYLLQRAQWWRSVAACSQGLFEAFELRLLRAIPSPSR